MKKQVSSKRILALMLSIILCLSILPVAQVSAATVASGTCGDNVTWTLDDKGKLTISGTGQMDNSVWTNDRITSIEIKEGVTSIGDSAFSDNSNLTSVKLPASMVYLGQSSFARCAKLNSITVAAGNKDLVSEYGILFDKDKKILFCYPGGKKSTTYKVPDGVTDINTGAFSGCTSLTSVTLPDSVIYISRLAFDACSGLTTVNIPENVTTIDWGAFRFCSSLTSITIPDSVTNLENNAFQGCTGLKTVTVGNGVTRIGAETFSGCSNLTDVYFLGSQEEWKAIKIYDGNDYLTNANIHYNAAVDNIIDSGKCGKNLTWSLSDKGKLTISGTGEMDARAFQGDTRIVSVEIEDGVTNISGTAFHGCTNLTSVTIPNSVTSIGENAFYNCTSLTSVTIPDSVTYIGFSAFLGCTGLKTVTISDSLPQIGWYVFRDCSSLTTITIPDSITQIGFGVFIGCTSLTDVYYAGSEEAWKAIDISDDNIALTNATIHFNTRPTTAVEMDISPYRKNGNFTAPTKSGYTFAGWYQDAEMTKPLGSNVTKGKAYAKFVDENVLSVKWQVSSGTNANSKKTSLRVLTTVDDLTYSQVGFTVVAEGKPVKELTSKTVYRTIYGYTGGNNEAYRPQIFSPSSQYFMVHTLTGIPQSDFQKEIKVTPKWVTLDGTPVNGKPLTIRICDAEGF